MSRYRRYAKEILERHFQPAPLCAKLDANCALIRDALKDDPFPHTRVTVRTDTNYDDIVASMKDFIRKRYAAAKAQLEDPGSRPKLVRRNGPGSPRNGPRPGTAKGAPTEFRASFRDGQGILLEWKDNAKGEAGHVVQRALDPEGKRFGNHIGRFGLDNDGKALDRDVRRGQTYRYRVYAVFSTPAGPRGTPATKVVTVRIPAPPSNR